MDARDGRRVRALLSWFAPKLAGVTPTCGCSGLSFNKVAGLGAGDYFVWGARNSECYVLILICLDGGGDVQVGETDLFLDHWPAVQ